jgi:radical SAM superfamily enzyme YgiQ (UPF0313 family)
MPSPTIVLVASLTEASEFHHSIWQQMLFATIPARLADTFIDAAALRPETWPDGRAKHVPNGLRVVERLLLDDYDEADVVTCYVTEMDRFVGPETAVVALHAHNPLGQSYATDVYTKLAGADQTPVNASEFIRILEHPALRRYRPIVVAGGPGAWQLTKADRLDALGIDYVIEGEVERVCRDLFRRIVARDPSLPRIIRVPRDMQPQVQEIPVVRHRSTFGVVEITRGCGRGCQFCSPAIKVGRSFPLTHIVDSARVNLREGATEIMLASEDIFLYEQHPNFLTNIPALETLLRSVTSVPGLETLQLSHITMAPVVREPDLIERLTPLTVPFSHLRHEESTDADRRVVDPIVGLETGSPRLFDTYMKGKAYPYKAKQWRDVVLKGMEVLNRHNWYPFCTFIIGLPGETEADTRQSLDLLFDLRDAKGMFVPTWFVPLDDTRLARKPGAKLVNMTDRQWEFFFTCWKYNLEFYRRGWARYRFSLGVPLYYAMLGRRLFGRAMKYPLWRFAGVPERLIGRHLYLNFSGRPRRRSGLPRYANDIVPAYQSVQGLGMIDLKRTASLPHA